MGCGIGTSKFSAKFEALDQKQRLKQVRIGSQTILLDMQKYVIGDFFTDDIKQEKYFYFENRFRQLSYQSMEKAAKELFLNSRDSLVQSIIQNQELTVNVLKIVRRKGFDQRFRWAFWKCLTDMDGSLVVDFKKKEHRMKVYESLQQISLPDVEEIIQKDSVRTAKQKELFSGPNTLGTRLIERVCKGLGAFFPKSEYVQGMNFLACFLLEVSGFDEFESWNLLVNLFKKKKNLYFGMYEIGFPLLMFQKFLFHEILRKIDKKACDILDSFELPDDLYLTRWYLTLFTTSLTKPYLLRVWDYLMLSNFMGVVWVSLILFTELKPLLEKKDISVFSKSINNSEELSEYLDFTRFVKRFKDIEDKMSNSQLLKLLDKYKASLSPTAWTQFEFYYNTIGEIWRGPVVMTDYQLDFVREYNDRDFSTLTRPKPENLFPHPSKVAPVVFAPPVAPVMYR